MVFVGICRCVNSIMNLYFPRATDSNQDDLKI